MLVSTDKAVAAGDRDGRLQGARRVRRSRPPRRASPSTRYAAVRFGNVLGSSGSVVPIFRRQIERGGPVTVTDERMTRYFMTIPEAVQLIIRSGSLAAGYAAGNGGRWIAADSRGSRSAGAAVFVLDMGEPVRIVDLARAMIDLSGLDPDRDIDIEIVGRRPGEKLHEELFNDYERALPTHAEKILRAEREPLAADVGRVDVRRDRAARARGRRRRPRGEGLRAVGGRGEPRAAQPGTAEDQPAGARRAPGWAHRRRPRPPTRCRGLCRRCGRRRGAGASEEAGPHEPGEPSDGREAPEPLVHSPNS